MAMTRLSSGPDPSDWLFGLLRGLHPLRWLLCLIGLAVTALSAAAMQALFDQGLSGHRVWLHKWPRVSHWW